MNQKAIAVVVLIVGTVILAETRQALQREGSAGPKVFSEVLLIGLMWILYAVAMAEPW